MDKGTLGLLHELHQVALVKGLYEQFGARIVYIGFSSLEYHLPDPIMKMEYMEKAAKTLIVADNDYYGDGDYEGAADRLPGSHNMFMWWDCSE